jgi:pyruvate formate lyase activating enzyme
MSIKGLIFNIQRYSIHDGPGIRTLVFMKGCPLRCLWCDNPEGQLMHPEILFSKARCIKCWKCVDACPVNAIAKQRDTIKIDRKTCNNCRKCAEICYAEAIRIAGKWVTVEEVLNEIKKDTVFYEVSHGGITVGGGEPTMQTEFVTQLLKACKEHGINTAIETCGYTKWKNLQKMLKYLDLIFYDIKHMDSEKHQILTGKPNELILENLKKLSRETVPIIIRIPLVPGYNDQEENIKSTANFVRKLGDNIVRVEILPYHRLGIAKYKQLGREYQLNDVKPLSKEQLQDVANIIEAYDLEVQIGG